MSNMNNSSNDIDNTNLKEKNDMEAVEREARKSSTVETIPSNTNSMGSDTSVSESIVETSKSTLLLSDHGYSKSFYREGSKSDDSTKECSTSEDAPLIKKVKLCPAAKKQVTSNSVDYDTQKQRMDPCPPLTKEHIDLLLSYISNPKLASEQLFLMQIKLSNFPRIKRYSVARQLERWSKLLTKQTINGKVTLCLCPSEKIIIPKRKYATIIRDAHENFGNFLPAGKDNNEENEKKPDHNSYHKTLTLIESEYGVGGREFGMSKFSIYEYVANCRECTARQKKLPSISKVLSSNEIPRSLHSMAWNSFKNGTDEDYGTGRAIDSSNDLLGGDDAGAPISMLWEKPSPGSIWHNQQGLASEVNAYSKLLGVIQEIGLDLTASIQGDIPSKNKFLTKLYCATRLIQEMKTVCERAGINANTQFMIDYLMLQEKYIEMGKLDLFLYDVNLLAIKYNLTRSELFMQIVNNCVAKFNQTDKAGSEISIFDQCIDVPSHLLKLM